MRRILGFVLVAAVFLSLTAESSSSCANSKNTTGNATKAAATVSARSPIAAVQSATKAPTKAAATKAPPANVGALQAGATAKTKQLAVTLVSITDPYTGAGEYPTDPDAGNRWVAYHVQITNAGSQEQSLLGESMFQLKTSDNHVYTTAIANPDANFLKAINLGKGEITEGNVYFQVPQGATPAELHLDTGFGSDDIFFRTQ